MRFSLKSSIVDDFARLFSTYTLISCLSLSFWVLSIIFISFSSSLLLVFPSRTIIITHRPVVRDGWREDFGKIFDKTDGYFFTAKSQGNGISQLEDCLRRDVPLIHFASIQDLRGSSIVGGNFDKNDLIFKTEWDLVIIDEAHEGTLTSLGDEVKNAIIKEKTYGKTRVLELSGTPFNLLDDFEQDEIYTWDYVMEQKAKYSWDVDYFLDSNPYEGLPKLEIFTYNLGSLIKGFVEMEDNAFNFAEFFRTWTGIFKYDHCQMPEGVKTGDFVHEADVRSFLNLMCKSDDDSNYPYSCEEYREYFRHTLWMVPGVREARALSRMLKEHDVFGQFEIVNVAGDGDEEEPSSDALEKVRNAIGDDPDKTWTITLSCGKLTTGVSVKPWTAVMMLAGTYSTSAANYLQTIFRVQTPANINGRMKDRCYVFDFAPDRTLKMVAEAGKLGIRPGNTQSRANMGAFLNFCPVIAIDGSEMKPYDVDSMLQQLKRAYAKKVVESGFTDNRLYNDELLKLDDMDIKEFESLKDIVGKNKANDIDRNIVINNQGLTDEEREQLEKIDKKNKKKEPLTEEEKKRLEQLKKAKEERGKAINILRAISIRIPMLIYGMDGDFDEDITIDKFVDSIDDTSWEEFMPQGVSKKVFNKFKKYYDRDIFIAAGKQIRAKLKGADGFEPTERVKRIAEIFSSFKNPDKETVLTPWRVVNMHISDTLGGYDFYDENHEYLIEEPTFIYQGEVTDATVANTSARILEINSKSGLYPLFVTYSIFRKRLCDYQEDEWTEELFDELWNRTVQENVYVICKTPMAKSITRRTLLGFRKGKVNAHYFENLVGQFKNQPKDVINKISQKSYWLKGEHGIMKFDAIVGNPPYQENIGGPKGNASLSKQLFPYFIQTTIQMNPDYISLITPSRWFTGEAQDKSFIKLREFLKDRVHFRKLVNFRQHEDVFKGVEIPGGVNYFLYDSKYDGNVEFVEKTGNNVVSVSRPLFEEGLDVVISNSKLISILNKVRYSSDFKPMTEITQGRNAFGVVGKEEELHQITTVEKDAVHTVAVRCAHEEIRYINPAIVEKNRDIMSHWKIFTSKGNGGAGLLTEGKQVAITGRPYVAEPNSICTDSLIPIGCFDTEIEAENLKKFLETKFCRFLIGILKTSQNLYQNVYGFVPILDFKKNWTDEILFEKYQLTEEEKTLIETMIRPM